MLELNPMKAKDFTVLQILVLYEIYKGNDMMYDIKHKYEMTDYTMSKTCYRLTERGYYTSKGLNLIGIKREGSFKRLHLTDAGKELVQELFS